MEITDIRVMTIRSMESRFLGFFEIGVAEAGTGGVAEAGTGGVASPKFCWGKTWSGKGVLDGFAEASTDISSTTGSVSGVTPLNSSGIAFNYIY